MLLKFQVTNFKSFSETACIDMMAMPIREHANSLIDVNGNKILPIASLFGANASGKSNLFKALHAMRMDIVGDYKEQEKHSLIKGFIFDSKLKKEPSEFEICIRIDDKEYRYGFLRNQVEVFEEWLFEKKFAKGTTAKEKCIFYRSKKSLDTDIKNKKEVSELEYVSSMLTPRELLLNGIGRREKSVYSKVYEWFVTTITIQDFSDDEDQHWGTEMSKEFLYEEKEIREEVAALLTIFDKAIQGITVEKEQDEDLNDIYEVYSYHLDNKGKQIKIPFSSESSGTKKIFALAVWIMYSLSTGAVLIVDELDAKLHPLVLRYLLQMYRTPEVNIGKGQLIFSSHNLVCLDSSDLRRDEIWFVEKNNQKSSVFSLYDFKDDNIIRSDLNFGKNYLSGRFGAVPFLEEE